MSGRIDVDVVLSRTETALEQAMSQRAPVATGRLLGTSHQTVGRWGSDLDAWRLRGWIHLLCDDEALRTTHVTALTGAEPEAIQGDAVGASLALVRTLATELAALGKRLSDLRLNRAELRATDQELMSVAAQITAARAVIYHHLKARG